MNSHDDNEPLHPYIEPEIEARLTALVLGEASDFEREELKRLIGERPELGVLRKRLEAIHGMLREVAKGEPEEGKGEWKLSDDRRRALLAVIDREAEPEEDGEPVTVMAEPKWTKKSRVAVLWQVAACLAIAAVLFAMAIPVYVKMEKLPSPSGEPNWAFQEEEHRKPDSFLYGDFDAGMGTSLDSPYLNKPDEGNLDSIRNPEFSDRVSRRLARITGESDKEGAEVANEATIGQSKSSVAFEVADVELVAKPSSVIMDTDDDLAALSFLDRNAVDDVAISAGEVTRFGRSDAESSARSRQAGDESNPSEPMAVADRQENPAMNELRLALEGDVSELQSRLESKPIAQGNTPVEGKPASSLSTLGEDIMATSGGAIISASGVSGGAVNVGGGFEGGSEATRPMVTSSLDISGDFIADSGSKMGALNGTVALGTGGQILVESTGEAKVTDLNQQSLDRGEVDGSGRDGTIEGSENELKSQGRFYAGAIANFGSIRATGTSSSGGQVRLGEELADTSVPEFEADKKAGESKTNDSFSTRLSTAIPLPRGAILDGDGAASTDGTKSLFAKGRDVWDIDLDLKDPEVVEFDGFINYGHQITPSDGPISGESPVIAGRNINRLEERSKKTDEASHLGEQLMAEGDAKTRLARKYAKPGDFDTEGEKYSEVLNEDQYNSAARRGLDEVNQERLNYFDTARNQTRSEFMKSVATEWELPVPESMSGASGPAAGQEVESGAEWGVPMAGGDIDRNLGRFGEAQHEWREYPKAGKEEVSLPALRQIMDLVPHVVGGEKSEASSSDPISLDDGIPILPSTPDNPTSFKTRNLGRTAEIEVIREFQKPNPLNAGLRSGAQALDGDPIDEFISDSKMPVEVGSRYGNTTINAEVSHFALAGVATDLQFAAVSQALGKDLRVSLPAGLDEMVAADESFSTFSLHVSDVAFKLAQSSLAKGEWPDAERIRIEEFVNAFDYGDPMPSQADRVACQVEQAIHPFLQQRNLLRVSMRTAAEGRAASTPLRLTLLLDNSGSMERSDRQEIVRRAFATLAGQLQPTDQVTLISFARQPRLLADAVSGAEANRLVESVVQLPSEGGTNLEAALKLAFEKAKEHQTGNAQNRIVLLTDGAANLGDAQPENLSRMIESMRQAGIAFDAAGIGAEGLNDEILEALTRKGDGRYYLLDRPEDADDGFAKQIAGALRPAAKNVKVQVEFNPDRVGNYKLLGFEKHLLNKEDFRDDAVDAAEMAAAEAGVAVYQVEPKADGEGDIGSVSVRFLDLASGQMVEKRWPISYVPNPARPEQAATSLRLATVAAQFAAKLKGGPLGDVVDLGELDRLTASLPESDQKSERVQQLRQMIQQARQLEGSR